MKIKMMDVFSCDRDMFKLWKMELFDFVGQFVIQG